MFNVGGAELMVIFLIALIFLGPHRLPDAARQVGKFMAEMRRMSSGFQKELQHALDDPTEPTSRRPSALTGTAAAAAAAAKPAATATPRPVPDTPLDPEVAAAVEAAQAVEAAATVEPSQPDDADGLTS